MAFRGIGVRPLKYDRAMKLYAFLEDHPLVGERNYFKESLGFCLEEFKEVLRLLRDYRAYAYVDKGKKLIQFNLDHFREMVEDIEKGETMKRDQERIAPLFNKFLALMLKTQLNRQDEASVD